MTVFFGFFLASTIIKMYYNTNLVEQKING